MFIIRLRYFHSEETRGLRYNVLIYHMWSYSDLSVEELLRYTQESKVF